MASRLLVLWILLKWPSMFMIFVRGQSVCRSTSCGEGSECYIPSQFSTNLSCRCKNGYTNGRWNLEDGTFSCTDFNECLSGNHLCLSNSTCGNIVGGYVCTCPADQILWMAPNGEQHCTARGVNICFTSLSLCGVGTRCETGPSSYKCVCQSGYTGVRLFVAERQYKCEDIDECQTAANNCGDGAICVNTVGSFDCRCPAGTFRWTGPLGAVICTSTDICRTRYHLCGNNTNCESDPRSETYNCSCWKGYVGPTLSGETLRLICKDKDECADDKEVCDRTTSRCVNNAGSFSCQCKAGFASLPGQENICEDIDECSNSSLHACPDHSTCENLQGTYRCPCQTGYHTSLSGDNTCERVSNVEVGVGLAVAGFIAISVIIMVIVWFSRDKCKKKKPVYETTSALDLVSLSGKSEHLMYAMTPSAMLSGSSHSGSVRTHSFKANGTIQAALANGIYHVHSVTERMVRSRRRQLISRMGQVSSHHSRRSSNSQATNSSNKPDYFETRSNGLKAIGGEEERTETQRDAKDYKGKSSKGGKVKGRPGTLTISVGHLPEDVEVTVDSNIVTPNENVFTPSVEDVRGILASNEMLFTPRGYGADIDSNTSLPDENVPTPHVYPAKTPESVFTYPADEEIVYDHLERIKSTPQRPSFNLGRPRSFGSIIRSQEEAIHSKDPNNEDQGAVEVKAEPGTSTSQ